jgi:hypothetical protein
MLEAAVEATTEVVTTSTTDEIAVDFSTVDVR